MNRRDFFKRSGIACLLVTGTSGLSKLCVPPNNYNDLKTGLLLDDAEKGWTRFVVLFKITFPNTVVVKVVHYTESIIHEGEVYEPFPVMMEVSKNNKRLDLTIPFIPLKVNELVGSKVCIKVIALEYRDEAVITMDYKVDSVNMPLGGNNITLRLRDET